MVPRFIVVTVNYHCADEIVKGLDETVRQITELGDGEFWIVDNQSADDSVATLNQAIADRSCQDRVKVLVADKNGGFGAGNNVAIRAGLARETPPEYFYFLNPDAIPQPGAIASMLGFLDTHPDVAVVGGLLCDEEDNTDTSLFRFPSFQSEVETALRIGIARKVLKNYILPLATPDRPASVDWVAGTSFVVRASALEKAGLFDETFFLYWEEIELCHRIRKAGLEIYGLPDVRVMHIGGVSTGMHQPAKRIPGYWHESRNYFFRRTGLVRSVGVLNAVVVCCLVLRRMHQFVRGRPLNPPHFLRDFIRHSFQKQEKG
jgi:GT2 family glycosyltransferase